MGRGKQKYGEKNIMPPSDLRKLHLIELDLLLELDRICRKHNIEYIIAYGTLLGAVRHGGFIPWDDDLDTCMLRSEYERFCVVCEKELDQKKFFLQNDKTDKEYRWGYAKLRRKGTEYIRDGQEAIKCFSGVSIDIFVMDNVPDFYPLRCLHFWIRRACIKTLWSVVGVTEDPCRIKRMIYCGLRHVNRKIPLGIMEWMARKVNKRKTEYLCPTGFYRRDQFTKRKSEMVGPRAEWFGTRIEIEFEGFPFYTIKEYDAYLKDNYGNYMSYPPESKRYLHPPKSYCLDVDVDLRGRSMEDYMRGYTNKQKNGESK